MKRHENNFEYIAFHMIEIPVLRKHFKASATVPDSKIERCFVSGYVGKEINI